LLAGIAGRQVGVVIGVEEEIFLGSHRDAQAGRQHVARRLHSARDKVCAVDRRHRQQVVVVQHLVAVAEPKFGDDFTALGNRAGFFG